MARTLRGSKSTSLSARAADGAAASGVTARRVGLTGWRSRVRRWYATAGKSDSIPVPLLVSHPRCTRVSGKATSLPTAGTLSPSGSSQHLQ